MDLPGHGALADRPFSMAAASEELARVIESAAGGSAIVVGLSLGGYVGMDLAATRPDLVRGLVLSGATQEPVGLRSSPYLALAWVMDRLDGRALGGLNAWFFRTRYPPAIADPIVAGGFFGAGWRRRSARLDRRTIRAAAGRLRRPGPHPQRRARPAVPGRCRRLRAGRPGRAPGAPRWCHAPCQSGPPGGVQPWPSGASPRSSRTGPERARC